MKGNQITTKLCENLKSNKKYHNISISIVFHIKMSWEEGPTQEKLQMDSSPFVPTNQTHAE